MSETDGGETIQAKRQRVSGIPRACEACNVRKIRCDRVTPCSNCVAYKVVCQGPSSVSKKRSKPDPISYLEERIASFEDRLRIVEARTTHHDSPAETAADELGHGTSATDESPNLYEGESSFSKQLSAASHIAKTSSTRAAELYPSFDDLYALTETSSVHEDHRFFRTSALRSSRTNKTSLPVAMITDILHRIKERLCLTAYNYRSITPGHIASVYGILCFLLKEFIATSDPLCQKYDLKMHLMNCEESLKTSIESFEVLAVPSFLSILALAFGALKAQEDSKPFLMCTLISAAANQCRTLGYHRQKTYENKRDSDAANQKRLFWSIYVSDKTLSLLLGRASCLQDFDIDAQYPVISTDPSRRPWDTNFIMAIRMARLQGQIFDNLYSPISLGAPSTQRAQTTEKLTSGMNDWRSQFTQVSLTTNNRFWHPETNYGSDQRRRSGISGGMEDVETALGLDLLLGSNDSTTRTYSLCDWVRNIVTVFLLRAPRSPEPHDLLVRVEELQPCIGKGLRRLVSLIRQCLYVVSQLMCLSRILSYSSFTPFLVIFLRVISAPDEDEDLKLLEDVIETLGNIRGSSKHSEKLYKICSILGMLAKQLAGTRTRFAEAYHLQDDMLQFEEYENIPSLLEPQAIESLLGSDMTEYLHDWEAHDIDFILASWADGRSTSLNMTGECQ
ncbi:hypothetical protein OPT61_g8611 [Boeremia exigua]|uniref:Uncharacterized protein n=1 Tax=Boeremia exigua TaxID=749465 RepID=A0ACC2HXW4_9PLEO|nr:hypothetical protein OPT61_g8611 [Boeremia exigua]